MPLPPCCCIHSVVSANTLTPAAARGATHFMKLVLGVSGMMLKLWSCGVAWAQGGVA
jgi:hypothetical protein